MISKSTSVTTSQSDFCINRAAGKYLAITLLVIAIVSVAAALLFHFQFRAMGYTIGFGGGAVIALIASGYFSMQTQEKIPAEIKELDQCTSQSMAETKLKSYFDKWIKDTDRKNEAKWNERYQIAAHYWDKFGEPEGFDDILPVEIRPGDENTRWGVIKQLLTFGAKILTKDEETDNHIVEYFKNMKNNSLVSAAENLKNFQSTEVIVIQSLKIYQKTASRNEKDWLDLFKEHAKQLKGKCGQVANFITQNKLPENVGKLFGPIVPSHEKILTEITELDQCQSKSEAENKFTSYTKNWEEDPDLENDAKWTARYQIAVHFWNKFGEYGEGSNYLSKIKAIADGTRWAILKQYCVFGAQVFTKDETTNQAIYFYFYNVMRDYPCYIERHLEKFQTTEVIVIQSLKIYQRISGKNDESWLNMFKGHAKQLKGKCDQVVAFITQNKLPEKLRDIFANPGT